MRRILLATVFVAAVALPALAAVTPNSVITPQTPKLGVAQFLQGTDSAGTYKTVYAAGSNGSRCNAIYANNNDGSATHLVTVQIVRSAVFYGLTAATTVSSAGYANAVPAQNLLAPATTPGLPLDSNANPYIFLANGDTLQATFATALTSATWIDVHAICMDY